MRKEKEIVTTGNLELQLISSLQPEFTLPEWPEKPQAKNLIESDPRLVRPQKSKVETNADLL